MADAKVIGSHTRR